MENVEWGSLLRSIELDLSSYEALLYVVVMYLFSFALSCLSLAMYGSLQPSLNLSS